MEIKDVLKELRPLMVRLNEGYPAVWSNGTDHIVVPEKPRDSESQEFGSVAALQAALKQDARFQREGYIGFVCPNVIQVFTIGDYCAGDLGGQLDKKCPLVRHPALVEITQPHGRPQKEFLDMIGSVVGLREPPRIKDLGQLIVAMKNLRMSTGGMMESEVSDFERAEKSNSNLKVEGVKGEIPPSVIYDGPLYLNAVCNIQLTLKLEWRDSKFFLTPLDMADVVMEARAGLVDRMNQVATGGEEQLRFFLG
jgi:hypothetical protein